MITGSRRILVAGLASALLLAGCARAGAPRDTEVTWLHSHSLVTAYRNGGTLVLVHEDVLQPTPLHLPGTSTAYSLRHSFQLAVVVDRATGGIDLVDDPAVAAALIRDLGPGEVLARYRELVSMP